MPYSDDEFDPDVCAGARVIDGLNFRELIETGSTNFVVDEDEIEDGYGDEERMRNEVAAVHSMEDPFVQLHSSTKFHGIDENGDFGTDFDGDFDEIEKRMESIEPSGGVKKLIIQPGLGDEIGEGKIAYFHYFVCLEGVDTPVDNSRQHVVRGRKGQPFRHKVGKGTVIPAIELGLSTMQPREIAKFLAQPDWAYGNLGAPPRIPANTRAMVTIEIVGVEEGSKKFNLAEMERSERKDLPFDELYKGVTELKVFGNDAYKLEEYTQAKNHYKEALRILQDITTPNKDEEKLKLNMVYIMHMNIAQCNIVTKSYKSAKVYCENALSIPLPAEKKLKAHYRLAKVLDELGHVELSREHIDQARSLAPGDQDIIDLYDKIHHRIMKDDKDEKQYAKNMFLK